MHMQNSNRLTDIENKLVVTKGRGEKGEGQIRATILTQTTHALFADLNKGF